MTNLTFLPNVRFWLGISLLGYFINCATAQTAVAEVKGENLEIIELGEFKAPVTSINGLLSQSPTPTNPPATPAAAITITGVKANPTDKGVEVILETTQGDKLQITNRNEGNNFIADIPNAQLRLSSGEAFTFRSEKPLAGIIEITVTNIDANTIRVDLFNPIYGQPVGAITFESDTNTVTDELGIIIQDQVTIADNLKLLISGRFDSFTQNNKDFLADTETSQSGSAFSPRIGIVYQPITPISLYANYSRSFEPAIGQAFDGSDFEPTRGTQYEVGIKADLHSRLSTTLAFYDITQSNILTEDPNNPGFSIQTGEQRSQGIELSLAGEILPGWNVFASYAYNDARVTQDNSIPVGNRVQRTTPHAASLWTTYEIQRGNLQGLGFGLGLFYVGDRAGDAGNTFEVPSYLTTNAAIFYKKDRFRAAINIRNLFDVDYFENAFNRLRVSPGEPFTVQGTISWTF